MASIYRVASILLFIFAIGQNALKEIFSNNVIIGIAYYFLFWVLSFLTFYAISQKSDRNVMKLSSFLLGAFYPLLYAMDFINTLFSFGENIKSIQLIVTLISFILFLLFSIGLFVQKELNNKTLRVLAIISIIHTVLFLISPVLTFFSKWLFYGAVMIIVTFKKKENLLTL